MDLHKLTEREIMLHLATSLDIYHKQIEGLMTKVFVGLMAVAGASIGVRFIGSPLITVISGYAVWFASAFLLGATVITWRRVDGWGRLVRLILWAFMTTSITVRTFVYHAGEEVAPRWYPILVDVFFAVIAVVLVATVWTHWDKSRPWERRGKQ